jgi:hypothetical protein
MLAVVVMGRPWGSSPGHGVLGPLLLLLSLLSLWMVQSVSVLPPWLQMGARAVRWWWWWW